MESREVCAHGVVLGIAVLIGGFRKRLRNEISVRN